MSASELLTQLAAKTPGAVRRKVPYYKSEFLDGLLQEIHAEAVQAAFIFFGVAAFQQDDSAFDFIWHLGLDPQELKRKHPDVVAICGNYALDKDGQEVDVPEFTELMRRPLSFAEVQERVASEDCHVVAVCAGADKAQAALAVTRGFCNTLITDSRLADRMTELLRSE